MTIGPAPMCFSCTHFHNRRTGKPTCAAFPNEIPGDIWSYKFDHRKPREGDHGIVFSPTDDEAEEMLDFIFYGKG